MPLNFKPVSDDKYLSIEKKLEADKDNYFNTDVLSIYQNDDGQVIFVSKINESKNIFKSKLVKYINISKTRKPLMTQVVTKLVVSTTLDNNPLLLSVEHWKSLNGFNDHINIESIAPAEATKTKSEL